MKAAAFLEIEDKSRVSQCRRKAKAAAMSLGFSEVDCERVGIAVTESVSNVLRHAGRGWFLVQALDTIEGGSELCVLVGDEGPGIANVSKCLADGYSSAGGQGIGLGAMRRQSDRFDLYSIPSGGLLVGMGFHGRGNVGRGVRKAGALWDVFGTAVPLAGQEVCGDAWLVQPWSNRGIKALLVDGLGHGPKANLAASRAVECFLDHLDEEGESMMYSLNEALKGTRGAVAAVLEIDRTAKQARYTGVGNIFGRIVRNTEASQLISMSGTVGYQMRRPRSFEYPWSDDSMTILHSDGLSSRWDIAKYPGLPYAGSSVLAGTLFGGHRKASDDSSIVCIGMKPRKDADL